MTWLGDDTNVSKRDQNYVPTMIAVSSTDGKTPVVLYADPTTHRLYVDLTGSPAATSWGSITGTLSDQTDLQTALNAKQATITGGATTITSSDLTVSRALISNASGKVAVSSTTDTELSYVSGVTSAIQTQLNTKLSSVNISDINATGTPSATTYLRGDGTWATVSGGGSSPLTTKGDLYTFSTVDARLPVGTNGQVLSADSTEATGLKWIAAGGTGTVTSVSGAGTVSGLTLTGTVTTSGSLTLGGTLSGITNANLSGTAGITNANLANSSITIAGTSTSLGGSISLDTITGLSTNGFVKRTGANTYAIDTSTYLTANQTITLSGDISGSGSTAITTTIGASKVTNTMLAGSITISKLSITGTPDGTKFLRDDGSWQTVSGGGGGLTWNNVTGTSQTASVNNGYIANNASLVTVTLPSTASVGDVVRVAGNGAGKWKVAQNASQVIHFLSTDTTTGTGGSLSGTTRYDGVELVCTATNTDWVVASSVGNITIV